MPQSNLTWFRNGVRDGMPIALGYLAVSFTLGIAAKNIGLTPFQAMLASLTNNASAGEFAGFTLIAAGASYWELAVMTLITNARYLLMSCSLSQKLDPETPLVHRMLIGYDVTDEIFGISIAVPDKLNPCYNYGAMAVALPGWALGTLLGAVMGNVLPVRVVSALSVGLYGMFIAIIIPPSRQNRVIGVLVALSMAASWLVSSISLLNVISPGMRIILLTVLIAGAAAVLFPVKEGEKEADRAA
ncbi:MAG: AzlC family ABC transporter permease [Intestinimonas sp.]|jgi:predicted branched-subunit amino acid permease|nr:AzlC family ABC transporter permease [Intestinimonas sp.]